MAVGNSLEEAIRQHREMMSTDDEPIHSEQRTVSENGGALYANITSRAKDVIGIEAGDEVTVHTYRGFAVIEPAEEGNDVEP